MTSIVQTIQHGNLLREGDWRDQSVMDIQKLLKGATIYRASLRRGRTDRASFRWGRTDYRGHKGMDRGYTNGVLNQNSPNGSTRPRSIVF